MKKSRIISLSVVALIGIGSAFATISKPLTVVYKDSGNPQAPCAIEDICTLTVGNNCDHIIYQFNNGEGGTCTTPIDLKRP